MGPRFGKSLDRQGLVKVEALGVEYPSSLKGIFVSFAMIGASNEFN